MPLSFQLLLVTVLGTGLALLVSSKFYLMATLRPSIWLVNTLKVGREDLVIDDEKLESLSKRVRVILIALHNLVGWGIVLWGFPSGI